MITNETLIKTRQWFADNTDNCIADVKSGKMLVNDPEKYFSRQTQNKKDFLNGVYDHGFAFVQRATFIETGECKPLFSV